eukprot:6919955-Alexandrium_andersonii.AAC.1
MGESARTRQLGAPLRVDPSCEVKASSPIERRPSRGGTEGAPKAFCGAGLAPLPGGSAIL